jgi:hypothetical protein
MLYTVKGKVGKLCQSVSKFRGAEIWEVIQARQGKRESGDPGSDSDYNTSHIYSGWKNRRKKREYILCLI